jgi:endonuclease V-like protein UPF0215 family
LRKAYLISKHFIQGRALKLFHIPQVKDEIRVLGVAAGETVDGYVVIGVVFRGNKELDGVLSARCRDGLEEAVASMFLDSKHRGQVRVIFLDEKMLPFKVDAQGLWEKTGKPVIMVTMDGEVDPRFMFRHHGMVFTAAGIELESAKRVIDVVYGVSGAEALRIAGIILERILKLHNV